MLAGRLHVAGCRAANGMGNLVDKLAYLIDERGQYFLPVSHNPITGFFEYISLSVFVDGYDSLGT